MQNKFVKKEYGGKEYGGLSVFLNKTRTNPTETKDAVFSMLEKLKYMDKSLQKATIFNSEVMIKCSKYYAIRKKYVSSNTAFGFTELDLTQLGL